MLQPERIFLYKKGNTYNLPVLEVVVAMMFIAYVVEVIFASLSKKFSGYWKDVLYYYAGSLLFL